MNGSGQEWDRDDRDQSDWDRDDDFGMPPPPPSELPRTSGLAIGSFVLGLIGVCCGVTAVVGLPLGIAAIVSIRRNRALQGYGLALAGVIVSAVMIPVWGVAWFALLRITKSFEDDVHPVVVASAKDFADALETNDVDRALTAFVEGAREDVGVELRRIAEQHGPFESVSVVEVETIGFAGEAGRDGEGMSMVTSLVAKRNRGGSVRLRLVYDLRFAGGFRVALRDTPPFRALEVVEDEKSAAPSDPEESPGD